MIKIMPSTVVISMRKPCSSKITLVLVLVPARLHKLFGSGTALHDAEVCILCYSRIEYCIIFLCIISTRTLCGLRKLQLFEAVISVYQQSGNLSKVPKDK